MIEDGVVVLCESGDLINAARKIAHTTINAGPLPLDEGSLDARRYGITDLAEALRDPLSSAQRIAVGNSLYAALTTFALRAGGHWSASGKALPSALSTVRPALADQFTDAFERFYVTGEATALHGLVDDILAPYGGRLRNGFKQKAPVSWRDHSPSTSE